MYEQLDDDLKKRIGEVFENMELPTAEEGWLLLREKFPAKQKKLLPIFWYRLGAAALFLFLLGISFLVFKDQNNHFNLASQTKTPKGYKSFPGNSITIKDNNNSQFSENHSKNNKIDSLKKQSIPNKGNVKVVASTNNLASVYKSNTSISIHQKITKKGTKSNFFSDNEKFANHFNPKEKAKNSTNLNMDDLSENLKLPEKKSERIITAELKANSLGFSINIYLKKFDIKMPGLQNEETKPTIYSLLASTPTKYQDDSDEKNNPSNKKIGFSIYEATYLNYAKGSNNQVNLGLGLSTDIYLAKNIKLITGINIGKNSLAYSSSAYLNTSTAYFASSQGKVAANPISPNGFTPATQLKNYNVGLIGLDIPMNLKYELEGKKNNYYVVTGLSSGTFINETYSYQYTYQNSSAPLNQQSQGSSTSKNFNSFYLAKTINLAFGADLPFGKNNIIFEPFIKYPIGGLGSQDIRFGASGLNLKFKF